MSDGYARFLAKQLLRAMDRSKSELSHVSLQPDEMRALCEAVVNASPQERFCVRNGDDHCTPPCCTPTDASDVAPQQSGGPQG